jgi:hypothetical protein
MNEIIVVISLLFCSLMALTWNYVNTEETAIRKYSFIHKQTNFHRILQLSPAFGNDAQ